MDATNLETTFFPESEYAEFTKNTKADYWVNAAVVLLCFVLATLMLVHTLHQWGCRNKKDGIAPLIKYTAIATLAFAVFNFFTYCVDLWFMRIFPPDVHNYDPFTFCKGSVFLLCLL